MTKTFETPGALKWFSSCVRIHVADVIVFLRKLFLANWTLVLVLTGMDDHVSGQCELTGERGVADVAPLVLLDVTYIHVHLDERLVTHVTGVPVLTRVELHVEGQF